ncbi:KpsF/GutQ family sugar-phosphate isomerase [Pseudooceanicola sediminis]|uniref:KpsF/GutQ family sugar-phosphate isomerase n=1 Tax=Pseudooceanicola sediminis TaxID=2211117 RepID=A0A399IZK4_9RHOB|nr:KpsF/GutQ family sugar-phosphate isomerase [Pseudooceanicola sediminis]KAA2313668.1 KpsF/GutQ family sugar-phosphate isomerase [Puniceibacterium sp. HSS470]RII38495.1 KpsF/GutQ family sugar-phosphate isomerase [Pseudooceanicola sediminis]|tara:strand:- start:66060 stop:67061 length:1002 start_codon:yes stop_codon:yes gene_type:complete
MPEVAKPGNTPATPIGLSSQVLDIARRVLRTEAEAVAHLADHMPADFTGAVARILASKGRVIVSGMGKSGHIGRKIAATLASTGTPAQFVHPAEASHGDLGMVTPADICLLISNSGETSELRDLVYHSQRFSIPMIGISSRPGSTLMQAADYRLTLPNLPEACSIGMAPTTSTTLTLAIGDALAVALMEERHFLPEDFRIYHPGGKLGAQMARVSDLMHGGDDLPVLDADSGMNDVLLTMTSKGFGIAGLTQDGKLVGVITDGDLRRNMDGLMQRSAREVATQNPLTAPPDMLAPEVLALLNARKLNVLLVVDAQQRPQGVLHIHDLLRAGVM